MWPILLLMHLAQNLAGMSFSNEIYLPNTVLFNGKNETANSCYAEIAQCIGLNGSNNQELVNALVDQIKKMRRELDMPASLKECGIDESVFQSEVDNMAVIALYIAAYNGEDIAF